MKRTNKLNIAKTALATIVVNAIQIAAVLGFVIYVLTAKDFSYLGGLALVFGCAFFCIFGAVVDILDARDSLRQEKEFETLQTVNRQMEELNHRLRAQRHDFLNHLQVTYSLIEMQEYQEALSYLDHTYQNLSSLSTFLRTKQAAFNALLQAKNAACKQYGITFTLQIKSALEKIAMPSWELCGAVGNLIDNAVDALKDAEQPQITVTVEETVQQYMIRVSNNGSPISPEISERIFEAGFSTKGEDRGLGLYISRNTLRRYGAELTLQPDTPVTFTITVPRLSVENT